MPIVDYEKWTRTIETAFPDQKLSQRIFFAAAAEPAHLPDLLQDIGEYVLSLKSQIQIENAQPSPSNATKKRKLEEDGSANPTIPNNHLALAQTPSSQALRPVFECKDVSVQIPARKKMKIELAADDSDATSSQLRLFAANTGELEYGLRAADVEQVFCLPMPEKQARQTNFVLFPRAGALDALGRPAEQVLFVMNETPPAQDGVRGEDVGQDDTYVSVTERALERWLRVQGKAIVKPDANEFASSITQSHRKGEKAYHVRAHRGSKEGFLFFLANGIVFGFKKPLAFFPFSSIASISYTSVLQRTFNLVIAAMEGEPPEIKEVEFSMLDQEDFAGIDAYVKRHALNDASMAAQRRAKAYNVNKEKKVETNGDATAEEKEEDEQTELQKAEQQLQDEEDELEEDYEASGGESEGEEDDSEEEEEYEDDDVEEVEEELEDEEDDE